MIRSKVEVAGRKIPLSRRNCSARKSKAVSEQITKGWRRRKNVAEFVLKMNEAEGEAAETQVWLEYSVKCLYIPTEEGTRLHKKYDQILGFFAQRPEKVE